MVTVVHRNKSLSIYVSTVALAVFQVRKQSPILKV
jgi:hypothetical protein